MSTKFVWANDVWAVSTKFSYNLRSFSTIVSEPRLLVMHNLVVHSPKSNFLLQLSLKINATFLKNKRNFFGILVLQKLSLIMSILASCDRSHRHISITVHSFAILVV